ncbi:hypothetical protein ACSHWB_13800 [Lentzea sp. HUAS TT2]|uniref:hypothetical protein n=1 Tax=Lentzea sp. HUAS TT2 TaxID=3447454 RepID=UPI003F71FF7F
MIKGDTLRMLTLVAAMATTFCVTTPAFATEQVSCSAGSDVVKINWVDGSGAQRANCYGEIGELGVTLPRSSSIEAGDNAGWVEYTERNGSTVRRVLDSGQVVQIGGLTVTRVRIY